MEINLLKSFGNSPSLYSLRCSLIIEVMIHEIYQENQYTKLLNNGKLLGKLSAGDVPAQEHMSYSMMDVQKMLYHHHLFSSLAWNRYQVTTTACCIQVRSCYDPVTTLQLILAKTRQNAKSMGIPSTKKRHLLCRKGCLYLPKQGRESSLIYSMRMESAACMIICPPM